MDFITAVKFLTTYMKNFKKQFVRFYLGWLLDSILTVIMPILFGIMIDEIVYYQNTKTFIHIALLYFVCILLHSIINSQLSYSNLSPSKLQISFIFLLQYNIA